MAECHHECELFTGRLPESEESEFNWETCEKNPGHEKFISVPDVEGKYQHKFQHVRQHQDLRAVMDLTVRLRVRYTSRDRPDGGDISDWRGTNRLRVGTGFVWYLKDPVHTQNMPCRCILCGGKVKKQYWEFEVQTALHVVYNTEEAKNTTVDFFFDDKDNDLDGTMKSVRGLEVLWTDARRDLCRMTCVTCDESLGKRIDSTNSYCYESDDWMPVVNLRNLNLPQSWRADSDLVLIISHPHAQPKQLTIGELRYKCKNDLRQYNAPTCPGSSGAPVFLFYKKEEFFIYYRFTSTAHNGSFKDNSQNV